MGTLPQQDRIFLISKEGRSCSIPLAKWPVPLYNPNYQIEVAAAHGRTDIEACKVVTEEFLREAIEYYKIKYGLFAEIDNYVIYFYPSISDFKNYVHEDWGKLI